MTQTCSRGYAKSTWWDAPPAPPTVAKTIPDAVAFAMLEEAVKKGNDDVVNLMGRPKEVALLKSYMPASEEKAVGPQVTEDGIEIPTYPGGLTVPIENKDALGNMREWVRKQVSKNTGIRPQDVKFAVESKKLATKAAPKKTILKKVAPPAEVAKEEKPVVKVEEPMAAPEAAARDTLPVALLFPGQGSQYVKMLTDLQDNYKVKEYCAIAEKVLGYDVLSICLNGPEEKLEDTSVCQPAMYLAGMAALEKLKATNPEAAESPGAVAGLSLGEYTALCCAGVFTFEQGMELVKIRAEAMSEATKIKPQAMLSVAGLDMEVLDKLCKEQAVGGEVCQVANQLFPKGFACAGTKSAVQALQTAALSAGAMQAKMLKTSGGFHTDLMRPAQAKLEKALKELESSMKPPTCDVYMNVTGKKIAAGTSPKAIVPLLADQLCSTVLWEQSVRQLLADGVTDFYEVGPMKQLKAMMKRIDPSSWARTVNVDV
mmetsp:Transcript_159983/g.282060  ORF Transcript_159983/g.282060 Transcript_159983/m.282060 type:complete len:485 (+) Transcript_159983:60-1514(+)